MIPLTSFAKAIAREEGFFEKCSTPNLPQRCHNPGDLEYGDRGLGTDNGKTIFASDEDGWQALYHQLQIIKNGESKYYRPSMSLAAFCLIYSGGDQHYAENIASMLSVPIETPISLLLGE